MILSNNQVCQRCRAECNIQVIGTRRLIGSHMERRRLFVQRYAFYGWLADTTQDNAPKAWSPTTDWEGKMKDIMWSFDDTQPRFRHEKWREVFDSQLSSTPFSIQSADPMFSLPLGENSEKFTYWLTPEAVWDRFRSLSQISVLTGQELAVQHSYIPRTSFSDIESGHQEQSL